MYGNQLSKIGRKGVPEFQSRKVYCGFPGVCSYLLYVICILVYEFMIVYTAVFSVHKNIDDICSWKCVTLCINMPN